jgi:hypothetical protein
MQRPILFWSNAVSTGALVGASVLALAGCRPPTPPEYSIVLSLYEDTVRVRRFGNEVVMELHVQVSNHDNRAIFYDQCGHALQYKGGAAWRAVWTPLCHRTDYSIELGAGASTQMAFQVRAALAEAGWPTEGLEGEYRMVLFLTAEPKNPYGIIPRVLAEPSRTTPTFPVRLVSQP